MKRADEHRKTTRGSGSTPVTPPPLPAVTLGVFGKHPAWRDFVSLNPANDQPLTAVYEGIYRRCLDVIQSGVWGADIGQVVPRLHHHLVQVPITGGVVVGMLVASRDQLGRQQPLLVAAHAHNTSYHRAVPCLLPLLGNLANQISALPQEQAVQDLLKRSATSLTVQLDSSPLPAANHASQQLRALLDQYRDSSHPDAIHRVVYQLIGPDATDLTTPWQAPAGLAERLPAQIRLPLDRSFPGDELDRWLSFVFLLCGRQHRVTVMGPVGRPWADLVVGNPGAAELAALLRLPEEETAALASQDDHDMPEALRNSPEPFTHTVPFTLEAAFRERVNAFKDTCREPPLEPLDSPSQEPRRMAEMQTSITEVGERMVASIKGKRRNNVMLKRVLLAILAFIVMVLLGLLAAALIGRLNARANAASAAATAAVQRQRAPLAAVTSTPREQTPKAHGARDMPRPAPETHEPNGDMKLTV